MQVTDRSPDAFLADLPEKHRPDMLALDALIAEVFTGHPRVMWEGVFWGGTEQQIIGYGDLVQPRPKGDPVAWFMVGLALQKSGPSLYVNALKDGQYIGKAYAGMLGKVKIGAASIGIKTLADVNLEALTHLLSKARAHLDASYVPSSSPSVKSHRA